MRRRIATSIEQSFGCYPTEKQNGMDEYLVPMPGIAKPSAARLPSVDVDSFNIEG